MCIHTNKTPERSVLLRRKRRLLAIERTLTKPLPQGGWNSERVFVEDSIRLLETRIHEGVGHEEVNLEEVLPERTVCNSPMASPRETRDAAS